MDNSRKPGAIAFVCAMPMELRPLVRKLSLHKTQIGDLRVRTGMLEGHQLVAIVTGMGTELAKTGTGRLLDAVGVQRVVVVGITGAVDNTTPIGTLVLPEVVVDSVSGVEYRPAPFGGGSPHGTMWTTDLLLTDTAEVADLRARGVVSVDMETAAVAEVCEGRGIPWSVFRAISDRATDGSIDEEIFQLSHRDGTPNGPAVARYFLRHPARIPRMVRLGRGVTRAAKTAAAAAAVAVRACSHH